MLKITKVFRNIENVFANIGLCGLFLMMVIGAFDVIGRYVFNKPIFGSLEVSLSLLTVLVVFIWARAQARRKQVTVDILTNYFPAPVKNVLDVIFNILILGLFALFAWRTALLGVQSFQQHRLIDTINLPQGILYYIICAGASLTCLELCLNLYFSVAKLLGKESDISNIGA